MKKRETKIINTTGLHGRPASLFANEAKQFNSKVKIRNVSADGDFVNAKSVVMLLSAGISQHCQVEVMVDGDDEDQAIKQLIGLIDSGFGEE